jgi:hypothetical protein
MRVPKLEMQLRRLIKSLLILLMFTAPACAQICLRPNVSEEAARGEQLAVRNNDLPYSPSTVAQDQADTKAQRDEKSSVQHTTQSQEEESTIQPTVVDPFSYGGIPMSARKGVMTVGQKFAYFEEPVFGPRAIVTTAFGAGFRMAQPHKGYPHEWRAGAAAFGRNYGDIYARDAAMSFGRFTADSLVHEDPRYSRSQSTSFFGRFSHALGFTFIAKSDGGHAMPAFGNFVGAAASGFVGNAYLPNGWNDTTHAGQRSLTEFGGLAAENIVEEFAPEIGRAFMRLHIPKLPLPPVWW